MNTFYVVFNPETKSTEVVTGITATKDDIDTLDHYLTRITTYLKDRKVEFDADLKQNKSADELAGLGAGGDFTVLISADRDDRLCVKLYNTTNVPMDVFTAILVTLTYGY